jgi:hypothetical protein
LPYEISVTFRPDDPRLRYSIPLTLAGPDRRPATQVAATCQ